jgi:hypothetical protein
MSKSMPVLVPSPSVNFPEAEESLESEVFRLRRMVHSLAEILVESGIVDSSIVEGRLRLSGNSTGKIPSLRKPSWWSRLFKRKKQQDYGAVPMAMMPIDQTVPVQKMPFEVQSLYDETGGPSVVAPAMTRPDKVSVGTCARCWKRAPINSGSICARCAVQHG